MATTNYTYWDIGACNCNCATYPCALPNSMTLTAVFGGGGGTWTTTVTKTGACTWTGCLFAGGSSYYQVTVQLVGSCMLWMIRAAPVACSGPATGTIELFDHPTNCSGITPSPFGRWTLTSFSCTPINIVFTKNALGLISTYTFTP
jgi:hypothetical protein